MTSHIAELVTLGFRLTLMLVITGLVTYMLSSGMYRFHFVEPQHSIEIDQGEHKGREVLYFIVVALLIALLTFLVVGFIGQEVFGI